MQRMPIPDRAGAEGTLSPAGRTRLPLRERIAQGFTQVEESSTWHRRGVARRGGVIINAR